MNAKYLVAAAAVFVSSSALADVQAGSSYAGGQYAWATYDESGTSIDVEPAAIVARFGHFVVDNFALEGRVGTGIADDTVSVSGIDVEGEIDHLIGAYGVGYLPLGDSPVSLYGLVGFTQGEATLSAPGYGVEASESDSGFSYGVGIEGHFTRQISANLEYVSYLDKSDYEVTAVSLGMNYHF
ncbi:porin family protein [Modicisalibacter luteus]|uniref:Porin family protein n=1 Tax=Modicisalibacter luteus TaxID=453962 RepID=A0ABV7M3P4_9GAMM|nr:porin family protein [Halomonas lutea]GHA85489.1 hypothetical protein GCM10007159_03270 [Halomonas lutea]